jgi:hypothetical protein
MNPHDEVETAASAMGRRWRVAGALAALALVAVNCAAETGPENDPALAGYARIIHDVQDELAALGKLEARYVPIADPEQYRRPAPVAAVAVQEIPAAVPAAPPDPDPSTLRVRGIMKQAGRPVAVVNETVVQVGDTIEDFHVMAIGDDRLRVKDVKGVVHDLLLNEDLKKYEAGSP